MKRNRFFVIFSSILALLLVLVPSGLGLWFFLEGKGNASLSHKGQTSSGSDYVKTDDIAENYFFAADVDASDFYTVYFFPSPATANYSSNGYSTPMAYYEANISTFQNDTKGYWGGRDTGNNKISPDVLGYDNTEYGYKKFENVYRQLSTDDYQSLGDCFTTRDDGYGWYGYFVGFTANPDVATENFSGDSGYSLPKGEANFFDLNKPLSAYDAMDGKEEDNVIYLYAVYTSGMGRSDDWYHYYPSVHIIKNGDVNAKQYFQWMFIPSADKFSYTDNLVPGTDTNDDIPFYFMSKNVYISEYPESGKLLNTVAYKDLDTKNRQYVASSKSYNYGNLGNWWTETEIDLSDAIASLETGSYYNFYFYFNQNGPSVDSEESAKSKARELLKEKNLIQFPSSVTTFKHKISLNTSSTVIRDDSFSFEFFAERIYTPRIMGDIAGSYDYNDSSASKIMLTDTGKTETHGDKKYTVYESEENSFISNAYQEFALNLGLHYDYADDGSNGFVLRKDPYCYDEEFISYLTKSDGTPVTNPEGGTVYYGINDHDETAPSGKTYPENYQGNYNRIDVLPYSSGSHTTNDSGQQLPTIKIQNPGSYKVRAKIHFTDGLPDEILVSVAYLKGLFIEIHDTDPTDKIHDQTGETPFVDHSTKWRFRAFFNYDTNPLQYHALEFEMNGDSDPTKRYSINEVMEWYRTNKSSSYNALIDHVEGKRRGYRYNQSVTYSYIDSGGNTQTVTTKGAFTIDGGLHYNHEYAVTKNFILYPYAV